MASADTPMVDRGSGAALPPTEQRLEASLDLDQLSPAEVLQLLNAQDRVAVLAVEKVLPTVADVVTIATERMRAGGRVHYFGAGTSGRLAVLDAAELRPTYGLPAGWVVPHIAGGDEAIVNAVEKAEDSGADGSRDARTLTSKDVAIGITASGTTPYVGGALAEARRRGAATALISCNPASPLASSADHDIALETGPEVVTGSTRLKAGTAQKLVLNGFSTALMVMLGHTWSNLMVALVATNKKLEQRTVRILMEATGRGPEAAQSLLAEADGELKTALVADLADVDCLHARTALEQGAGIVRSAVNSLVAQRAE